MMLRTFSLYNLYCCQLQANTGSNEHSCGSQWLSQFNIPEFSRKTMNNLSKGEIKRSTRVEIINSIAIQMWSYTHYPSSHEYTSVLYSLVEKYPVLKDKFGNGIVSYYKRERDALDVANQ